MRTTDFASLFTAIVAAQGAVGCGTSKAPTGTSAPAATEGGSSVDIEPTPRSSAGDDDDTPSAVASSSAATGDPAPTSTSGDAYRVFPMPASHVRGDDYCVDGKPHFGPIKPEAAFAYLELVRVTMGAEIIMRVGQMCPEGGDAKACRAELAALRDRHTRRGRRFVDPTQNGEHILIVRQREAFVALTKDEELKAFFGAVDTPTEALFWALRGRYRLSCEGGANMNRKPDGYTLQVETGHTCGPGSGRYRHELLVKTIGDTEEKGKKLLEAGNPRCAVGRLPSAAAATREGAAAAEGPTRVAAMLAEAAFLEASAVVAFDELTEELRELEAPDALITWAREAREEEVRHARLMGDLARDRGASIAPVPAVDSARPPRSAFAIALHNAEEGLVRESYGAVLAHYQATHADDPELRAAARAIAADETRHAAFSWALHAYLAAHHLTADERRAVAQHLLEARTELRTANHDYGHEVGNALGMPPPEVAAKLLDALDAQLWGAIS
ncbi:MAG: ferritin-like domain-containing protein [Myxococcota bacterium]